MHECPQCGASAAPSDKKCGYCKAEFFITSLAYLGSFNKGEVAKYLKYYKKLIDQESESVDGLIGIGLCYLHTKIFSLAAKYFERTIDLFPEQSIAYYYYALSSIQGRRVRSLSLKEARQIEGVLQTAIQIDDSSPQYKLLLAVLKYDYYEANGLKSVVPTAKQLLEETKGSQLNSNEYERFKEYVKFPNQDTFLKNITIV